MADNELTEVERYELNERPAYRFDANRRQFVQVLGAGLVLSVSARRTTGQGRQGRRRGPARDARASDRLHVGADGIVTVLTGKVEVGQGARTQIAQAASEELRLPVERIQVVMADTERCPDDGGTAGSRTTPSTVPQVRRAAAAARTALIALAAQQLSVKPETVQLEDGTFFTSEAATRMTLGELAATAEIASHLDALPASEVAVTPVDQWKVLGTTALKPTGREVVTGAAVFPSDTVRPDMLYGKVLRPASFGAELTSVDVDAARNLDGVSVVRDGGFLGCTAPTSFAAERALAAIAATARWNRPTHPSGDRLFEHLMETASARGDGRSRPQVNSWGAPESRRSPAARILEATYTIAYIHHAPMEPRAAVAEWNDGALSVWVGTQQPARVRSELADAFRIGEDRVRVIVPDTGGGFGGKHTGEVAVEAARLARAAGQPVSVRWTRQEEFTWAYCRPAGVIDIKAGLTSDGAIASWDFTNYNSGASAIATPYSTASGQTRFLPADSPLRQGSYRALASTANTFARESMMDEMAHAIGADPLEFRLRHLPPGRLRDVLVDAARKFRWSDRPRHSERRGIGLACGTEKGSFVAACAEVEVRNDSVRIVSVCQAFECGAIQNPGNLRAQVEGCIVMGLGGALFEEMRFQDGVVTTSAFSQYRVPRMSDLPQLDIVLRDRSDLDSVGAGETPIIAVAPAVANAVFHAIGRRIRSMPLKLTG